MAAFHPRLFVILASLSLLGCAAAGGLPRATTTEERLRMIPLAGAPVSRSVTIHWSREQIPFIEAETDRDGAFALGLVHAHLRLGQMEILRRVSQGRIAEIAGPMARMRDIEQALRILDLGKTSNEVYARMAPGPKEFLDAFAAGVNHYQKNVAVIPHEYALLGIAREPWTPQEFLTLGRLASVDVSWLVWMRLFTLRDRPDWPELWRRALEGGTASAPSFTFAENKALQDLNNILATTARTGSNSFAVAGSKTRSGAAIIASDPHLGVSLPNLWLLAGLKTPTYHMAGLMVPGLPFIAVGRNPEIAWGGTNLRSAASDLIDVSSLPAEQITTREIPSRVRFWTDRTVQVRDTPYGPILSDAAIMPKRDGEVFALKWIGHRPSDEFGAMLNMNRAKNWEEFCTSLEPFSVSAQNFVYADTHGNVGQLTTTHLPRRSAELPKDIVRPLADAAAWNTILTSRDLPFTYQPNEGFVASANNKLAETPYPIGYFFSGDDRVLRMREVLGAANTMGIEDVRHLQNDTYMRPSARLRDALVARGRSISNLTEEAKASLAAIASWDARYDAESKSAVAFQATIATLVPQLADATERTIIETGGSENIIYADMIAAEAPGATDRAIADALSAAKRSMDAYPNWGAMHALPLNHQFSMLPVLGGRYRFGEIPWPGSSETLWRADHDLSAEKVTVGFGAQARHISDMSDLDSNWFALLGGNDGWFNSANFMDQIDAFRSGALIHVPLRLETVRTEFPHKTVLTP